jgi:mono/diheme cytochrome c family protein
MSVEPKQSTTSSTPEPKAGRTPVPVWLVVLLFILLYWAMIYFDSYGGWFSPQVYAPYHSTNQLAEYQPPSGDNEALLAGKKVYESNLGCAICHQNDGLGKPGQFPPLAGSEWAQGAPSRMIRIPLCGLSGPITVKGQAWNAAMPNVGSILTDDQLAAVLTYIRKSWGNTASEITPDMVKKVRGEVGGRAQPFTGDELSKVAE